MCSSTANGTFVNTKIYHDCYKLYCHTRQICTSVIKTYHMPYVGYRMPSYLCSWTSGLQVHFFIFIYIAYVLMDSWNAGRPVSYMDLDS